MKAKVHNVTLFDHSYLVMARSKAGALRDLFDHIKEEAHSDVATGQQVYEAGRNGQEIIGIDKYSADADVDPNQQKLPNLDVPLPGEPGDVSYPPQ